jgi:superfamily II DNA or RNA helicase
MTRREILRNLKRFIQSKDFKQLWHGQRNIFIALYNFLKKGNLLGYLKLPSGIGKTNLAIALTNAGQFKKVLFLVPTLTLVDQTDKRYRKFGKDIISISTFTGTKKEMDGQIVIATYQSIQRLKKLPIDPALIDLVIWDEVHEALSDARQRIMRFFSEETIHLGLTASDKFDESKKVKNLMPLIAKMEIEEAIKLNLLCAVECWIAQTNIDISKIMRRGNDYDIKTQKRYIDVTRRNQAAVDIYTRFFKNQTCLVTCINVKHAIKVAEIFQRAGIPSHAVWGSTQDNPLPKRELRQRLEDFKTGKIKVMTTVDLIGTGFDNTSLTALINLRITSSVVKATQRGGRVLRLFSQEDELQPFVRKMIKKLGGKLAIVVDFLDECKNHDFRPVLYYDILKKAAVYPPAMEKAKGNGNGDRDGYLWPPGSNRIKIKLITDVTQVAKITSKMTTFDNLPVADKRGIIFVPVNR